VRLATEIRWQDRTFQIPLERIRLTEELGYDAVFTSEGWGSDGLTPPGDRHDGRRRRPSWLCRRSTR
jgi:hypothetical protein